MKVTKTQDLLLLKSVDWGPKIIFGIVHIWWFLVKKQDCWQRGKWPQMNDWDPPPKNTIFPNLIIFDQKPWTTAHENDQTLCFLKNLLFLKNLKIDGFWPKSWTKTHETAICGEKNRNFWQKVLWCCKAIVHACSSSLQCWKEKKLSHMEAQKLNSYYISYEKSTDISGSYRAV